MGKQSNSFNKLLMQSYSCFSLFNSASERRLRALLHLRHHSRRLELIYVVLFTVDHISEIWNVCSMNNRWQIILSQLRCKNELMGKYREGNRHSYSIVESHRKKSKKSAKHNCQNRPMYCDVTNTVNSTLVESRRRITRAVTPSRNNSSHQWNIGWRSWFGFVVGWIVCVKPQSSFTSNVFKLKLYSKYGQSLAIEHQPSLQAKITISYQYNINWLLKFISIVD